MEMGSLVSVVVRKGCLVTSHTGFLRKAVEIIILVGFATNSHVLLEAIEGVGLRPSDVMSSHATLASGLEHLRARCS